MPGRPTRVFPNEGFMEKTNTTDPQQCYTRRNMQKYDIWKYIELVGKPAEWRLKHTHPGVDTRVLTGVDAGKLA